ncbi:protein of unknown function [Bradyrhizobium vignae]|uniref:Uncharacterized protein n=1 Tax=Bradyrhizobium vignae TaxID=1549949 RepID=A0A2U3Q0I8_9BRAD|nr:protein of unknown function [Bradyrhizobium vignae]
MSFSSSMGPSSRRHCAARLRAGAADRDAFVHAADPRAILGAFAADFGALSACMLVVRRVYQHEMRGGPAHLRAGHHQAEVFWLDVLAACLEAVVHRRAEACLVAAHAEFDAAGHLFGSGHPFSPKLRVHAAPAQLNQGDAFIVPALPPIVTTWNHMMRL